MPDKDAIDAVFILRKLQKELCAKGKKLFMCFVDLEKVFDRVQCVGMGNEKDVNTRSLG